MPSRQSVEENLADGEMDLDGADSVFLEIVEKLVSAGADRSLRDVDGLTALDINAGTGNVTLSAGMAITDMDPVPDVRGTVATVTVTVNVSLHE